MKTVCILLQNYYDMDIRVRRKAEALVSAGYEVDVLALRPSFAAGKSYVLNGVQVHTFCLEKRRRSLCRYVFEYLAFLLWAGFKLHRLTRQRAYAMVDVNNLPDFLVFAALSPKRKGAKVVFDMHEITPEFIMSKYKVGARHVLVRLSKVVERVSMQFADHIITINEPIRELLEARGLAAGKSTVIMNSVDEELFRKTIPASPSPDSSRGSATFVMMYHGTLTSIYGLDIALHAFDRVHAEMPGAEFWILGKGPEEPALQQWAKNLQLDQKVRFVGPVLPDEIPSWLRQCDTGVLPTRQDVFLDLSFSNKLSEYIIMNKPVIASRIRTIRHYFSEEALAFFEPHNVQDLAAIMLGLYRDRSLRLSYTRKAAQEYAPLGWRVMKQRYLNLTASLLANQMPEKNIGRLTTYPTPVEL